MGFENELALIYDVDCVFNQPVKKYLSLGVGGNAKYFAAPKSLYALKNAVDCAKRHRVPVKIIGGGTNLLVSDDGFKGIIITTVKLADVFFKRDGVFAMCGAPLKKVADFARDNGLKGFEKLSGIPATVGGAVFQNAGAFGASVSDCVLDVQTLCRGKLKNRYKRECGFGYRKSVFKNGKEIIVSAVFDLKKGDRAEIDGLTALYREKRRQSQPQGKSCGCVFKNPPDIPAGKLIEDAGLKGCSRGGATVSEKHANFIVTSASATAADVYNLILHIKKTVKDKFGKDLTEEVEYVGEF